MKPRIRSMIWNIRQKNSLNENSKKKKESHPPKKEDRLRILWDTFKRTTCESGVPEGEEKEQEIENLFEKKIMKENFPNLVKEMHIQVQET